MSEDNSNKELNCLVPAIKPGGSDGTVVGIAVHSFEKKEINTKLSFKALKSSRGSQLGVSEDLVCKSK